MISLDKIFYDIQRKPYNSCRKSIRLLNQKMAENSYLKIDLPITKLIATQKTVNPDFETIDQRYLTGDDQRLPFVVKYGSSFYVSDGHHRIVFAHHKGARIVKVRLFDLDGDVEVKLPILEFIETQSMHR